MEGLVRELFDKVLGVELPDPFPRMTYAEAMRRYASDKPDLRIPLELVDVADLVKDSEFKVFAAPAADKDGRVAALRVPGGGEKLSRKQIDDYPAYVGALRRQGPRVRQGQRRGEGPRRPAVADPQVPVGRRGRRPAASAPARRRGDLVFFGADKAKVVNDALGALRLKVGQDLGLVEEGWRPLWVVDFPMFEWDPDAQALGRDAPPVHRAGQRRPGGAQGRPGRRARPRLRHGAERLGDRRRLGAYPPQRDAVDGVRAARHRRGGGAAASSASCSRRSSTARRRTAASRSASTAWSC